MANKPGTFAKGNPGGPGRPKLPADIKKAANVTKTEFKAAMARFSRLSLKQATNLMEMGKLTMLEQTICAVMMKACKGDTQSANLIWDRLVGKVKDETVNLNVETSMDLDQIPREKLVALLKERNEDK